MPIAVGTLDVTLSCKLKGKLIGTCRRFTSVPSKSPIVCVKYGLNLSQSLYVFEKSLLGQRLQIARPVLSLKNRESLTYNRVISQRWRWDDDEVAEAADSDVGFEDGVALFNAGEYYKCHDVFEDLWHGAQEPQRGVLHGILQCSVGMYHLLNQNHRGAMVELGEGLNKLRRLRFQGGPFHQFEQEASQLLDFIYDTQLEHAACADDICIAMDGSEQSYRLLGDFGAGQPLYELSQEDGGSFHVQFNSPRGSTSLGDDYPQAQAPPKVMVPVLRASSADFSQLEHK